MKTSAWQIMCIVLAVALWSCSAVKHVPDGDYLLNSVKINITDNPDITPKQLTGYLRQTPNHKVLGFAKLQLATYSLSGRDSTKWYNRWLQRLGQPPVIYDHTLTDVSALQLKMALVNAGYLDAAVTVDTVVKGRKRIDVRYNITTGTPHVVDRFEADVPDSSLLAIMKSYPRLLTAPKGVLFDRNVLDERRTAITQLMHRHGYYRFTKEHIAFTADTARGDKNVYLTMHIRPGDGDAGKHQKYYFGKVVFITDYTPSASGIHVAGPQDTVRYRDITVLSAPGKQYLRPQALDEKCFIVPGKPYDTRVIERTYEALQQLSILSYINIVLEPAEADSLGRHVLDAYVLLSPSKTQNVAVELEGTNSEGDLGFGLGVTYQHRNIARGGQILTAKLRTSYESLSGNFNGLINDRYTEQAGEVSITFPKFEAPFLSKSFKQRMKANTEFSLSGNYQERPEYTRIIAGAAWKYKFSRRTARQTLMRHTFDFIDINYVYLPHSTIDFINSVAPANPLVRYSYEDHLIMRMGYTFSRTNRRAPSTTSRQLLQPSIYSLRASVETAGNVLYAFAKLTDRPKHDEAYKIFGTQFAQYVKAEIDYSYTINMSERSSLAMRAGAGAGYPYGNSSMIPFEKRFYAGGANGVRGWSVRSLGPGSYEARNSVDNFINQCGDISLIMSMEYRAKLFWVLESALFVDAGNVWTIRNYENQPGGLMRMRNFYKEIAGAYGVGIRFDFTYFLLRLDLGMKAHNPARGQEPWPLLHPRWRRDATFHFAVGYPF